MTKTLSAAYSYLKASDSGNKLSSNEADTVTTTLMTSPLDLPNSSHRTLNLLQLLSFIEVKGISSDTFVEGTRCLAFIPGYVSTLKEHSGQNRIAAIGCTSESQHFKLRNPSVDLVDLQSLLSSIGNYLTVAKDRRQMQCGLYHLKTCSTQRDLGFLWFKQGYTTQAEIESYRALIGEERLLRKDDPETIITATNLALIYEEQKDYEKAEELALQSLIARDKLFGPNDTTTIYRVYSVCQHSGVYI